MNCGVINVNCCYSEDSCKKTKIGGYLVSEKCEYKIDVPHCTEVKD